jgi:hypothetical protein
LRKQTGSIRLNKALKYSSAAAIHVVLLYIARVDR